MRFLNDCKGEFMLDTSVRLLRLLSLLQGRRTWSGAELAERLEVTGRTVRNDIQRLRILGYRVESWTGVVGGYRLGSGTVMPPLLLDDEEAVAVGLGLSAAAAGTVTGIEETSLRAMTKLEQTLPSRLRPRLDALRQATVSATGGGPTVDADTLVILASACRDTQQLRFDYKTHDGDDEVRRVEPYRLVYTGHRWFLLAWDRDRTDWRTFRADRIRPRLPSGPRFVPREFPEDAARHVVRGAGSSAWPYPARVRLHVPVAVAAEKIPPAGGLLTPEDEQTCLLETGGDTLPNLVAYLSSLDVFFTVLDPPELRDLLLRLAERYRVAADPSGRAGKS